MKPFDARALRRRRAPRACRRGWRSRRRGRYRRRGPPARPPPRQSPYWRYRRARRLISAGLPAPSTRTRSTPLADSAEALQHLRQQLALAARRIRAPSASPTRFPCTMTCAPVSVSGLSSTGFMCTDGATRAARACSTCARPISPPSAATPALFDMFCGLNGATFRPRRTKARQSPATISDLPTCEPVPWIMMRGASCHFADCQRRRRSADVARPFQGSELATVPRTRNS